MSVTIVGESAMLSDILSTAVFVIVEERGKTLLSTIPEVESAVFVSDNGGKLEVTHYAKVG